MPYNFLAATWGDPGHLGPTLAAAQQLRARGHNVRFIARADVRATVETAGFQFAAWQRTPQISPIARTNDPLQYAFDHFLFGPAAAQGADVSDEIRRATTDAVLIDMPLLGAVLAAEAEHVPCALLSPTISIRPLPGQPPIGSCLPAPRTPEDRVAVEAASNRFVALMNEWLPMLNEARASLQLGPSADVLELFDRPARILIAMSAAFDFAPDSLPGNVRYIGPLLDSSNWSKPWISPWSHGDRPRALISFSTTNQDQTEALQRTINAAGSVDMDAIATLGPALEQTTLQAPDNVTLLPSAPHDAVMKEASMVVSHGGHGTTSRALAHGLPLLVMPFGRDQGDIAARVEARGLGLVVPPTAAETEIAAAMTRLIREPQFLAAARRFKDIIAAEIRESSLVAEMEEIVRTSA
jgi:MGT family glycosyltransferase